MSETIEQIKSAIKETLPSLSWQNAERVAVALTSFVDQIKQPLQQEISSLQSDLASAKQTIKELQDENKELQRSLDGALKDRG